MDEKQYRRGRNAFFLTLAVLLLYFGVNWRKTQPDPFRLAANDKGEVLRRWLSSPNPYLMNMADEGFQLHFPELHKNVHDPEFKDNSNTSLTVVLTYEFATRGTFREKPLGKFVFENVIRFDEFAPILRHGESLPLYKPEHVLEISKTRKDGDTLLTIRDASPDYIAEPKESQELTEIRVTSSESQIPLLCTETIELRYVNNSLQTQVREISRHNIDLSRELNSSPPSGKDARALGFVYLDETLVHASYDLRYCGNDHFLGRPVDGYDSDRAVLTEAAAKALKNVENAIFEKGYALKIYDAYRPQRAVDHFMRWLKDEDDTKMKHKYYPEVEKFELLEKGYIAKRSTHSRGSTIDLTLREVLGGKDIDMGSEFGVFGPVSSHDFAGITDKQKSNRALLKNVMEENGFVAHPEKWWHYQLRAEPFPYTYFDFPSSLELRKKENVLLFKGSSLAQ